MRYQSIPYEWPMCIDNFIISIHPPKVVLWKTKTKTKTKNLFLRIWTKVFLKKYPTLFTLFQVLEFFFSEAKHNELQLEFFSLGNKAFHGKLCKKNSKIFCFFAGKTLKMPCFLLKESIMWETGVHFVENS